MAQTWHKIGKMEKRTSEEVLNKISFPHYAVSRLLSLETRLRSHRLSITAAESGISLFHDQTPAQ